jgi:hypothetical protein
MLSELPQREALETQAHPQNQPSWFDAFFAQLLAILKPSAPSAACTTFKSYAYLSQAQSGASVKAYQQFLIGQGEYTKATGYFGPLTFAAEASFASKANCN